MRNRFYRRIEKGVIVTDEERRTDLRVRVAADGRTFAKIERLADVSGGRLEGYLSGKHNITVKSYDKILNVLERKENEVAN
jgi:hypothetical protein